MLTIKGRLIVLGALTATGLSVLVGAGWVKGQIALSEASTAAAEADKLRLVTDMRLANGELVLAAMDTIIDKAEGAIQPERQKTIDSAIATLKSNTDAATALATSIGRPELTQTLKADIVEVEQAIAVNLPLLVKAKASDAEFAGLDDAIDGAGERLNSALSQLSLKAEAALQAQLASVGDTARSSSFWLMAIAGGFFALLTAVNFFTSRFITRSLWQFGSLARTWRQSQMVNWIRSSLQKETRMRLGVLPTHSAISAVHLRNA